MPAETNRQTSVRRITNPLDSSQYVDLKIIEQITFKDLKEYGQETVYTVDNSDQASREVHVVTVVGTDDPSMTVDVERVDVWKVKDDQAYGQETRFAFDNSQEPPVHLVTHIVKVTNPDNEERWLKVQRIDEVKFADPQEYGQETVYALDNLDDDTGLDAPTTTWDGTTINPPWRIDPFQNIVDVNWGGLAVEFQNHNNLDQNSAPIADFKKAVISLWFRIPQTAIDACLAATPGTFDPPWDNFHGTIPLVTIGHPQTWQHYTKVDFNASVNGGYPGTPPVTPGISWDVADEAIVDPMYIGLQCLSGGDGPNAARLVFNLQTGQKPDILLYEVDTVEVLWAHDASTYTTGQDNSNIVEAEPAVFILNTGLDVAANKWHHVLLSFDLTDGCDTFSGILDAFGGVIPGGVNSYSKAWYALDDVDYPAANTSPYNIDDDSMILTDVGDQVAAIVFDSAWDNIPETDGPATYSLTDTSIPAHSSPIGLPAAAAFISNVLHVEMAEFQLFAGITIDTGDVTKRRFFIDAAGRPVSPYKQATMDDPTKGSIEGLMRQPDILLHGSGNWVQGKNLGTTGIDSLGHTIIAGQFVPTPQPPLPAPQGIKSYLPDPSLHGPQGTPQ